MDDKYEPEIWVDLRDDLLKGTEDKYSISSYGRVWNKLDECFVSPVESGLKWCNQNYWCVNLSLGSASTGNYRRMQRRVHLLQALSFYGERPDDNSNNKVEKQTTDHIDRNRFNNSLWNLRWLDSVGQRHNATNLILYREEPLIKFIHKDYGYLEEEVFNSCRDFIIKQITVKGYTYQQAAYLYSQKIVITDDNLKVIYYKGIPVYLAYLANVFNVSYEKVQKLINEGYSFTELFPSFKIKEKAHPKSYEFNGVWYPTKELLCSYIGISVYTLNKYTSTGYSIQDILDDKMKQAKPKTLKEICHDNNVSFKRVCKFRKSGMSLVESLKESKNYSLTGAKLFKVEGKLVALKGYCDDLGISVGRVGYFMKYKNMSVEEAIAKSKSMTYMVKHCISGTHKVHGTFSNEVKRTKDWWDVFGLELKACRAKMGELKSMESVLNYFGIDTTGLTITPVTK